MKCKHCNGTGTTNWCVNGTFVACPYCGGTGEMEMEMTNEEWLRSATTEQLADVLWEQINGAFNSGYACCNLKQDKDYVGRYKRFMEWLKQPHTEKE